MTFEADLKSHLQSDATVSGLLNDRIHPMVVPEGSAMPCATYTPVFGTPQVSLSGFTSGKVRYLVQIDVWGATYQSVGQVALAIRDRLNVAAATFTSIVTAYPQFDDYEPATKRYRRSIEVACWHTDS